MTRRLLLLPIAAVVLAAGAALRAQVTLDRNSVRAAAEAENWLSYSGDAFSRRHSPLVQITPANVKNLELQWVFQAQSLEKFEATPLAVDGVLYTVQPPNDIVALDGTTGRIFWTYSYKPSQQARPCCGRVNRGLAILGDRLFMGTIDGHLIAVDARSGRPIWNVAVEGARPEAGYAITVAPQIVKDKLIIGPAGGDFGVRGFIAAYDPETGKELWRFYTIPGPGEAGTRKLGRRFLEARRWRRLGHGLVRSGSEPDLLGHRQSRSRLQRRHARRRQPVQRLGRRARSGHREAEVAFSVHAARRVRLRLHPGARSR